MTSAATRPAPEESGSADRGTRPPARLALKPDGPATGHVDGGWWPRSRSLEAELPALAEALRERLGPVETVSYHLGDWESPPRGVEVGGAVVRLGGYHLQHTGSVDVIAHHRRATLVVVGPEQAERAATEVLSTSAEPGNDDDVETLLARAQQGGTEQEEERT